MKVIVSILLAFIATITAFQFTSKTASVLHASRLVSTRTRMADADVEVVTAEVVGAEKTYEIVPVDKTNSVNAAAVTSAFLGYVLGGPLFAAILAAIANYIAKKEDDIPAEALRGVGKSVVESYNFLNKLNAKYSLTNKLGDTVNKAVSSIDSDSDTLSKVKETYASTAEKVSELNKEFDIVGTGKKVVIAAATVSDATIDKIVEWNGKVWSMHINLRSSSCLNIISKQYQLS